MAKIFIPIFKKQGFRVIISDLKTKLSNKDLVEKADIVIFSVPILKTKEIIHEVLPKTRKNQILIDFTSLKVFPVKEMKKSKAEVLGLHPMFGPGMKDIKNQRIVFCPERITSKNKSLIKNIFLNEGAKVHETTAKKHDEVMSIVQVLIHFHTIVLGKTLKELKVDLKEIDHYMSPIYRLEFDMIARIFSQDPYIYGPILALNPNNKKIIKVLEKCTKDLKSIILNKQIDKFAKYFTSASTFLNTFTKKAAKESNELIKFMSGL